ncbi:hypothetical protein AYI70_g3640 [Smittium culicis]|uniref:Arrestin C-terminal-like domain-containing protein n=1 Tax=Smittium culicis TaxID=133412 RepID=A0A1R1Y343_9FUNG|nr:hypothetical protein AYI70_g3640 [Smittium culicis]
MMNIAANDIKVGLIIDEPKVLLRGTCDEASGVVLGGFVVISSINKHKVQKLFGERAKICIPKSIHVELTNKQVHIWEMNGDTTGNKQYKKIKKHVVKRIVLDNLNSEQLTNSLIDSVLGISDTNGTSSFTKYPFSIPVEGNITETISHSNFQNGYYLKATVFTENVENINRKTRGAFTKVPTDYQISQEHKNPYCRDKGEHKMDTPVSRESNNNVKNACSFIESGMCEDNGECRKQDVSIESGKARMSRLLMRKQFSSIKKKITIMRDILVDGHLVSSGGIEISKTWIDILDIKITSPSNVYHSGSEIESIVQFKSKIPGIAIYSVGVSLWESAKFYQPNSSIVASENVSSSKGKMIESRQYNKIAKTITKPFTPIPKYNQHDKPPIFLNSGDYANISPGMMYNQSEEGGNINARRREKRNSLFAPSSIVYSLTSHMKYGFLTFLSSLNMSAEEKEKRKKGGAKKNHSLDRHRRLEELALQVDKKIALEVSRQNRPAVVYLLPYQQTSDIVTLKLPGSLDNYQNSNENSPNSVSESSSSYSRNNCENFSGGTSTNASLYTNRFAPGAEHIFSNRQSTLINDMGPDFYMGKSGLEHSEINCDATSEVVKISHRLRYSVSLTDGMGHHNYIWISSPVYIVPNRNDQLIGKSDDLPLYRHSYKDYMIQKRSHVNMLAPSYE